jgi:hypothetical protein
MLACPIATSEFFLDVKKKQAQKTKKNKKSLPRV